MMLLDLVQNLALLVALAAASQVIEARWQMRRLTSQILHGLLFGTVGVVGMMTPVHFQPGIIFDGRSIILSVGGLFGGPVVALLAALMCGAYRLWLGGIGTAMGVSVVLASAALGVAFYYGRRRVNRPLGWAQLWGFGLLVSGVLVGLVMLLPAGVWHAAWQEFGLAIIGIYPLATMLISLLFLDYEKQRRDRTTLAESEARYRTMMEQAADAVFMRDAAGRILDANRKACHSLGYTREELLTKNVWEIDPDAFQAGKQDLWGRVLAGENFTFESRQRRKDGSVFPVEVTLGSVRLPLGPAVLALVRDITQRKQAQETLRESEDRLNKAQAMAHQGSWELDLATHRLIWSDEVYRIFGLAPPAFAGTYEAFFAAIHPDDRAAVEAAYQGSLREGRDAYEIEHRIVRPATGETRHVLEKCEHIRDASGRVIRSVGMVHDITGRKQAEALLEESRRMLYLVLDTIPVRVFWKDTGGRFQGCNQSFACDAGFDSPKALIGKDDYDMGWKDQAEVYRADDRQVITSGISKLHYEESQTTPAGTQLWLRTSKIPLRDLEGRIIGILGTYEDITERKQLEAQFLRAQRLEGLGSLAGGIAHDLNNILTPILVVAPLLRAAASDAESRNMLDTVQACAQRGADVIRQLLTFARGQPGVRVPLPVRHILHEMEKIVSETFPRNLRLEIAAPYERWLVQGDATQIQQALMNLCVNARDAMPAGGTLTLAAENIALDAAAAALVPDAKPEAKPGDYVCISVTDTGTGIPHEQLDRVFDPFFTTKEIGRGTGLGLSTVLGIVRGHGGFVRVESRVGQGTKFELYLPASREAKEADAPTPQTLPPRGHDELILVVEDEAAVLGVVQCVLEQQGYRVLGATEGAEALALFAQHRADIKAVITDMMMPGVDGPTLVQALRNSAPRLPILRMSGLGEQAGAKGLEGPDPPEVLAKPFTVEALLAAVHRTLALRTPETGPGNDAAARD